MRPFEECPAAARRQIKAVLCDIDDTLTWQGRLPAAAYMALEGLRQSGLVVVPVTGRPAGWCDHIARMWPVNAVVGENGAFYFHYDRQARRMVRRSPRNGRSRLRSANSSSFTGPARCQRQDRERLPCVREALSIPAWPGDCSATILANRPRRIAPAGQNFSGRLGQQDVAHLLILLHRLFNDLRR